MNDLKYLPIDHLSRSSSSVNGVKDGDRPFRRSYEAIGAILNGEILENALRRSPPAPSVPRISTFSRLSEKSFESDEEDDVDIQELFKSKTRLYSKRISFPNKPLHPKLRIGQMTPKSPISHLIPDNHSISVSVSPAKNQASYNIPTPTPEVFKETIKLLSQLHSSAMDKTNTDRMDFQKTLKVVQERFEAANMACESLKAESAAFSARENLLKASIQGQKKEFDINIKRMSLISLCRVLNCVNQRLKYSAFYQGFVNANRSSCFMAIEKKQNRKMTLASTFMLEKIIRLNQQKCSIHKWKHATNQMNKLNIIVPITLKEKEVALKCAIKTKETLLKFSSYRCELQVGLNRKRLKIDEDIKISISAEAECLIDFFVLQMSPQFDKIKGKFSTFKNMTNHARDNNSNYGDLNEGLSRRDQVTIVVHEAQIYLSAMIPLISLPIPRNCLERNRIDFNDFQSNSFVSRIAKRPLLRSAFAILRCFTMEQRDLEKQKIELFKEEQQTQLMEKKKMDSTLSFRKEIEKQNDIIKTLELENEERNSDLKHMMNKIKEEELQRINKESLRKSIGIDTHEIISIPVSTQTDVIPLIISSNKEIQAEVSQEVSADQIGNEVIDVCSKHSQCIQTLSCPFYYLTHAATDTSENALSRVDAYSQTDAELPYHADIANENSAGNHCIPLLEKTQNESIPDGLHDLLKELCFRSVVVHSLLESDCQYPGEKNPNMPMDVERIDESSQQNFFFKSAHSDPLYIMQKSNNYVGSPLSADTIHMSSEFAMKIDRRVDEVMKSQSRTLNILMDAMGIQGNDDETCFDR